jgi:5-methylcytosine-specific restriction endonuclease McrA
MKKHGPKRILETKYLYCNKHGDCEHVESGIKIKKWKCCACTVDYSSDYRKKRKIRAVDYLGGKCQSCGYNKSISALTFHHTNPLFKEFQLGGTGLCKEWEKLMEELDKCMLLCSNCHIEIHAKEDAERIESNKRPATNYHKKIIHMINAKKLGKKPSP